MVLGCGCTLQWRNNVRDGVSNLRRLDCLLNCLFRRRSQTLRVTGFAILQFPVCTSIHGAKCCIMTSQVQHTAIYGSRAIRWTFSFICVLLRFHRRSSLKYDMVGSSDFCFLSYCAVYDGCKYSNTPRPKCRVCLCEHYTISFLSLCRLIRRHQTYT